jgi:hypothetical protein
MEFTTVELLVLTARLMQIVKLNLNLFAVKEKAD